MRLLVAIVLSLTFLVGWTQPGVGAAQVDVLSAPGSDAPGKATIVLFRTGEMGGARALGASVDDVVAGSVRREQYLRLNVAPGVHRVVVVCGFLCDLPDIGVQAEFGADRTYYFETRPGYEGDDFQSTFESTLKQLTPEEAARMMQTHRPGKHATSGT